MPNEIFNHNLPGIQDHLENWWNFGEQERPCFLITIPPSADAGVPDTDNLEQWWMDIDFTINRQMKLMDSQRYFGEAVPFHYVVY